jgi:excisionase family DNA binding protein
MAEELLRIEEVARRLAISRSRVYEMLDRGEIRALKLGKSRRVRVAEVDDFVERTAAAQAVTAR